MPRQHELLGVATATGLTSGSSTLASAVVDPSRARDHAFAKLYKKGSPLFEYASHLAATGVDGHEIVQDVIGDLAARDTIEALERYAMCSARHRALNVHRHERIYTAAVPEIVASIDEPPDPLSQLVDTEGEARLHESVATLPFEMRLVVVLIYFYGFPRNEAAFVLGLQPSRVTYLCKRATQSLRTMLRNQQCA
jgi:RNA polymerase sigma factor (sigma-70 family)